MASAGYHTQESNSTQPKVVLSCLARIPGRVQYSLQHRELAKNTIGSTKATNTSLRESISISSRRPKSYVGPKQIILTGDFLLEPKGRTLPPKRFIILTFDQRDSIKSTSKDDVDGSSDYADDPNAYVL